MIMRRGFVRNGIVGMEGLEWVNMLWLRISEINVVMQRRSLSVVMVE
tara:strand:- start:31 stop:171 length:141 start_codon:yes stop_codon:yes gene_type:complete